MRRILFFSVLIILTMSACSFQLDLVSATGQQIAGGAPGSGVRTSYLVTFSKPEKKAVVIDSVWMAAGGMGYFIDFQVQSGDGRTRYGNRTAPEKTTKFIVAFSEMIQGSDGNDPSYRNAPSEIPEDLKAGVAVFYHSGKGKAQVKVVKEFKELDRLDLP